MCVDHANEQAQEEAGQAIEQVGGHVDRDLPTKVLDTLNELMF